jgi:hypothetical protein
VNSSLNLEKPSKIGIFSKTVTLRICRILYRLRSSPSCLSSYPHLRLHRVFRGAVESLDAQVLFDPNRKQFHFPPRPAQLSDRQSGKEKIVGQEGQAQLVQNVDVVNLASGHISIARNAAPQIQQPMQFHRALAAAEFSPREKRQAQIDGPRVQGIHGLGQLHAERFVAVEVASGGNQNLSEN